MEHIERATLAGNTQPQRLVELLEAGLHFGHQTRRWNPKMRRFIWGERGGIYIIDLLQTERLLRQAQEFVGDLSARGGTVLFVGTKKQARDSVKEVAEACGMPYINHRWLGGLLTNFQTIGQRIKRLHDLERYEADGQLALLPTRERLSAEADLAKLRANLDGVKNMTRTPDAIFVVGLETELIGVREAQRLRIPLIGLVDTNCDPDGVDFVIPGNDDAIRSCDLITRALGNAIAEGVARFKAASADVAAEEQAVQRRAEELAAKRDAELRKLSERRPGGPLSPPPPPPGAPPEEPDDRHIAIWIAGDDGTPLRAEEIRRLRFRVGAQISRSLVAGPAARVSSSDVPREGVGTTWVVSSEGAELRSSDASSRAVKVGGPVSGSTSVATFDLWIPGTGDSAVAELFLIPKVTGTTRLRATILVEHEVYRELTMQVQVEGEPAAEGSVLRVVADDEVVPAAQVGMRAASRWSSPTGCLMLIVHEHAVVVHGMVSEGEELETIWDFSANPARLSQPIADLRAAAEAFTAEEESYFDAITPEELQAALGRLGAANGGQGVSSMVSESHMDAWQQVATSSSLKSLAASGRRLLDTLFPRVHPLRSILSTLPVGHRLELHWTGTTGSAPTHLPLGLLYLGDPEDPIDPELFFGLRFRLVYRSHMAEQKSLRHAGRPEDVWIAHCLYWGDGPGDLAAAEAKVQREVWDRPRRVCLPVGSPGVERKQELLQLLRDVKPRPMPVVYLFCHADVEPQQSPTLRFGSSRDQKDVVAATELPQRDLDERPLIFANACRTSSAGGTWANDLEERFFERGCRAYIGTEAKVPIVLASRFALVFFHIFTREVDGAPVAAGEAVTQTRLLLWRAFRNLGGLLYCCVNQHDLFLADEDELVGGQP